MEDRGVMGVVGVVWIGKENRCLGRSIFLIPCFVASFKEMSCSIILDSKTTFQEIFIKV